MNEEEKIIVLSKLLEFLKEKLIDNEIFLKSLDIAEKFDLKHDFIVGILKSFESKKFICLSDVLIETVWLLNDEAKNYLKEGTPEWRLLQLLKKTKNAQQNHNNLFDIHLEDVQKLYPELHEIGVKTALKLKWISMTDKKITLTDKGLTATEDTFCSYLSCINNNKSTDLKNVLDAKILTELKARKLVTEKKIKWYKVYQGSDLLNEIKELQNDLTHAMLLNESWKNVEFKRYNFLAGGIVPSHGSIHPLMRMLRKFKQVLFFMGFEEMNTEQWVESAFWNFDALFQPQQHPARDAQDTFYMMEPSCVDDHVLPHEYVEKVGSMHETGENISRGLRSIWDYNEAKKLLLRTHTTASTAKLLYQMSQDYKITKFERERRFFSIDRVFRNETIDSTHLAEFHQIEGCVYGFNKSLCDLKGILTTFYERVGISPLRFKPTYNPYTEPSMEVYGYHKTQNKWMEVGNSGIFRPELLIPMGFPPNCSVLGWGLSLERPTMIRYNIEDIRKLFGHKANLGYY